MTSNTYTILTDQDRLIIVNNHIKNAEYALYGDEVALLGENSTSTPDEGAIAIITQRNADNSAKLVSLRAEAARLTTLIAAAKTN